MDANGIHKEEKGPTLSGWIQLLLSCLMIRLSSSFCSSQSFWHGQLIFSSIVPQKVPHRERTFGRGWKKLVSSEERVHLDKEWINTSVDVSSNGSGQEKMGYEDPEKQGVIQKWWNKWPTSASNIFSSGLMLTIGQADCWLGAWCELVDYQLIMWHFLLVWIFAHFRLGELLIIKSKRLVELC